MSPWACSGLCGCGSCGCGDAPPATPLSLENRPGLDALRYRVGTYGAFLDTMRAALSSSAFPALTGLRTRDLADGSVAFLDAWACVADVLTFYQERIADEGYLRTATERRSVLEQARLIGYRPRPGVAASVYLAYTIDPNGGPVTIPAGARVNSVPGPGEPMQAFETSEPFEARPEWNALKVRLSRPQTPGSIVQTGGIELKGTTTGLAVGDPLLVNLGSGSKHIWRVTGVRPDPVLDRTHVDVAGWDGSPVHLGVVRSVVRELTDLDRYGVDRAGSMARSAVSTLEELLRRAEGAPADAGSAVAAALPRLAAQEELARRSGWVKLAPWLDDVVTRLGTVHRLIGGQNQERTGEDGGDEGDLGSTVAALTAPPSVQPPSSRALGRSVRTAFAKGADTYGQLLTALVPALRPTLYTALANRPPAEAGTDTFEVVAFRQRATLFGANAPRAPHFNSKNQLENQPWPEWALATDEAAKRAFLDRVRPGIVPGTQAYALVVRPVNTTYPTGTVLTTVASVADVSRSEYGLSAQTTRVTFADPWWNPPAATLGAAPAGAGASVPVDGMTTLRSATVYGQPEALPPAEELIDEPVQQDSVELDALYASLTSGRWLILSGERVDVRGTSGVRGTELVMLAGVTQVPLPGDPLHTFLTFADPLAYRYKRDTVVLYANVVHATQGESRAEVLGAGNASLAWPTFTLKQSPLTYTSAPTTSGSASSLIVRVGGVEWHEAASLAEVPRDGRSYVTSEDDAGRTSVVFGDGEHGARLPTGVENVAATYRSGMGTSGNVRAEQISLLATKPLGVTGVVNPLPATGGADADSRDDIRRNAPVGLLALDRLVAVEDYAAFARTFAGVGKAAAALLSIGGRRTVHVTVAGAEDVPIAVTSDLYRNLGQALRRFGDPQLPVVVAVRDLLALVVSAGVRILPDYDWELVEPQLRSRLLDVLGFDRRDLGQDVLASEIVATMQAVRGVDYVDLDVLTALDEGALVGGLPGAVPAGTPVAPPSARVAVLPARMVAGVAQPAQLAYLQPDVPDSLILNRVTP